MSETTDIEKKSLEAHVELCAERYRSLDDRLDSVTDKISGVETVKMPYCFLNLLLRSICSTCSGFSERRTLFFATRHGVQCATGCPTRPDFRIAKASNGLVKPQDGHSFSITNLVRLARVLGAQLPVACLLAWFYQTAPLRAYSTPARRECNPEMQLLDPELPGVRSHRRA